jgi:hypothetical protein
LGSNPPRDRFFPVNLPDDLNPLRLKQFKGKVYWGGKDGVEELASQPNLHGIQVVISLTNKKWQCLSPEAMSSYDHLVV